MYSGLAFILAVFYLHGVMNGRVQVGCENDKALFLSSKKLQRVRHQRKHAYILRGINGVWTSIPLAMWFNHIHRYQDDMILSELMYRPSQINIECNVLLKTVSQGGVEK